MLFCQLGSTIPILAKFGVDGIYYIVEYFALLSDLYITFPLLYRHHTKSYCGVGEEGECIVVVGASYS